MKKRVSTLILFMGALAWVPPIFSEELTDCPTTVPSADLLGKPFPSSDRWYGSESLAVILRPDGIWRGMGPKYNYRDKLVWWSYNLEPGAESNLRVSARKLDSPSAEANISRPMNADLGVWTMLVLVEFPSAGCWEITGQYLGQTLSFVVDVRSDEPNELIAT